LHRERRIVRVTNFRPRDYWIGNVGWIVYFLSPIVPGWLISRIFVEYETGAGTRNLVLLLAALALTETGVVWALVAVHRRYMRGMEAAKALLRANVVDAQLASGGPRAARRNVPVGDVLVRVRDDPFDMVFLVDNWVDLLGAVLYGSVAVLLLVRIDPLAAFAGVGPLVATGLANRAVSNYARRYRARARAAASDVSAFLAATFEASLTVKVAGAQRDVLDRLDRLNAVRARAAVADGVWNDLSWNLNGMLADVFVGLALLVAARGELRAGDVTLFFSYLAGMTWLPMRLGGLLAAHRRYDVSEERLSALVAPETAAGHPKLLGHRPLPVLGGPEVEPPVRPPRVPLEVLEVRDLTVASRGLHHVDLTVRRGEIVAVRGPVGSGKTSLLRAVIGLLDIDSGDVRWNGVPISDRAAFFVPPQSGYVAQVPRLFAEPLADNLRLGHDLDERALDDAVTLAVFEQDLADLPDGFATLLGARGVRLSGGQAQRAAAARALVHRPELLVLDDLTSALDVETERLLWERLRASGATVLTASNRPVALQLADHVIDLGVKARKVRR
jgi:ATP-binding cassette subfamily B protein